ncbi:adenylate kinase [Candidatus Peregrinibacteria bacterium CG_4_9_14_3_um_filter_49_12]|nr:MAG: adenylate kinase [Candidatus Peregrinibacteria bacterium CG11_big_fil_rev_8_21_14_0_20_49_14]PJA67787.1 MAG: adenylate kinase [Candidatus Peregrinibacteria bacterium CG_4_9_14_3_um_filter_49_12]
MDLVLFGIQGSGKGTQAKKLAAQFGYDIFEAGAELRAIAASGSELGETVKSYIDAGNLVPHEIIMQVVQEAISKRSPETQILFDGIPRDEDQKKDFDSIMSDAGREFRGIQILLDSDKAVARILQRAREQGRADDADTDVIRKRMRTFHEKTEPVIASYKQEGKLTEVDGTGSVDEIYERLCAVL